MALIVPCSDDLRWKNNKNPNPFVLLSTHLNTILWKASGCPFLTCLMFIFSLCIMVAKSALACSTRDFICLRSWISWVWPPFFEREMWLWCSCSLATEIDKVWEKWEIFIHKGNVSHLNVNVKSHLPVWLCPEIKKSFFFVKKRV